MSSTQVPSSLRDLLADILDIAPDQVTPDLSPATFADWDSFRHLQIILALEGEYAIQFDPNRIPELTSVARLQQELEAKGVTLAP